VKGLALTRMFARKPFDSLQREASTAGLTRTLGPVQLILLGIGCILGAGIYVMPAMPPPTLPARRVVLSFVIAGIACGLTGLCYAELASAIPVSGSAYNYCYAGHRRDICLVARAGSCSWITVWQRRCWQSDSRATCPVWRLDFGVHIPAMLSTPYVLAEQSPGGYVLVVSGGCL